MTPTDLETMHGTAPVINALPGEPVPYYLSSGEGLRFETDGQLWTVIARGTDTGGLFDASAPTSWSRAACRSGCPGSPGSWSRATPSTSRRAPRWPTGCSPT